MTSLTHLFKAFVTTLPLLAFLCLTGQPKEKLLKKPDDYGMITKKISCAAIFSPPADPTDKPKYLEIYPVKTTQTDTAGDVTLLIVVRTKKGHISARFGEIGVYGYDTLRANYLYYLTQHQVPSADTAAAFQYTLPKRNSLPADSLVIHVFPLKGIFNFHNPITLSAPLLSSDSTCCKCPPCYYPKPDLPHL